MSEARLFERNCIAPVTTMMPTVSESRLQHLMSNGHERNEEDAVVLNCTNLHFKMLNSNNQIYGVHTGVHRVDFVAISTSHHNKLIKREACVLVLPLLFAVCLTNNNAIQKKSTRFRIKRNSVNSVTTNGVM